MQLDSIKQAYSSKTDDELLALAAEQDSLTEEARLAFAHELQRRGLNPEQLMVDDTDGKSTTVQPSSLSTRARWIGAWLLSTLVATIGVLVTVGFLTYSTQSFVSRATRIHLVHTPYYPVPIMVGLLVGYFSYPRFKASYRYWAWVAAAIFVFTFLHAWKVDYLASWREATVHFFGPLHYPENRDQIGTSMILYMAIAYSLGAFLQTRVGAWASGSQVSHPGEIKS